MTITPEESKAIQAMNKLVPPAAKQAAQAAHELQVSKEQSGLEQIKAYAALEEVQQRFINLLGDKDGRAYAESVVIAVANNTKLQACTPKSIMISAMRAASLKLSVDPIMKQAHLVPMGDTATLIIDYHGLVQLSVNTGYYEIAPNVFEVYKGETVKPNRFTGSFTIEGEPDIDQAGNKTGIGWGAYFKARNGTERYLYMTNAEIDAHGKKYSRGYDYKDRNGKLTSLWHTETDKMRRKTVLRLLVSQWGNFSPQVQSVIRQEDMLIDAETFDLPDDENLVIPQRPARPDSAIMNELGFSPE